MCVYLKQPSGSVLVPLKNVNWQRRDSHVYYSSEEPRCKYYYDSMHYYYLHPTLLKWFTEHDVEYRLFWCHNMKEWLIEIFDASMSVLFKLTFDE